MASEIIPKIALLSTGDELVNGDVLNTNSQLLAHQLLAHHIQPGMHATASDDQAEIEILIRFLLASHDGLIITGGLGPTSDDRTRFALANVLKVPLIFDEFCWRRVVERLERLMLSVPDTNRQQCLFPSQATIFPNENGTAAACLVTHGRQPIFMLPGPPFECLPIFETYVLPYLQNHGFTESVLRGEWLLLGVSEGDIARQLDPLIENSGCSVGYRLNPPYLEVKLQAKEMSDFERLRLQFEALIGEKSVSRNRQKASTQLMEKIIAQQLSVEIDDQATLGLLSATLLTPQTYPYLRFGASRENPAAIQVTLQGLNAYWRQETTPNPLDIAIAHGDHSRHLTTTVPYRQARTLLYAVEMICWQILRDMTVHPRTET
jgi:molybdenum cofactor synthesis domain-containing protein